MGNCCLLFEARVMVWQEQMVTNADNKQASINCIIDIESSFFFFEDVDANTRTETQLAN